MPFKRQEDVRRWERAYRQKRERNDQQEICDLEGELVKLVEQEPGRWDLYSLWRCHFQAKGYTIKTVQRAIDELKRARVFTMGKHRADGTGWHWLYPSSEWQWSMEEEEQAAAVQPIQQEEQRG